MEYLQAKRKSVLLVGSCSARVALPQLAGVASGTMAGSLGDRIGLRVERVEQVVAWRALLLEAPSAVLLGSLLRRPCSSAA